MLLYLSIFHIAAQKSENSVTLTFYTVKENKVGHINAYLLYMLYLFTFQHRCSSMDTVNQNVTNACCWHFDKMSDCVLNLQRLIYFKPECTLQKVINLLKSENIKNKIIDCPNAPPNAGLPVICY